MTVPVVKVELGPGATWQTEPANIGWVDVTSFVLQDAQIDTQRGASAARGQVDVGSLGLAFLNSNRYFDPTATSIPITVLRLTGAAGVYASAPDRAGLDITGDLEVVAKIAPDDWTPAAEQTIVAKFNVTGNQRSWRFRLLTTGALRFTWSSNGTATTDNTSTANLSALSAGAVKWVKVTFDVDNGAAGNDVRFYTSDDGIDWTQLGSTITTAGVASMFASTSLLEVGAGSSGTAGMFDGDIHFAEVRNGIGGAVVANPRFGLQAAGTSSFSDGQQTWTLNGAAAIVASTGAGPFAGFLRPGMPIRVTATPSGQSSAAVWYGSVGKWPQRYDIGNTFAWVPIEAWDGFDKLSRAKIPRSVLESEILADDPLAYWPLDETSGELMNDRGGNRLHGEYLHGTTDLATTAGRSGSIPVPGLGLDGEHGGLVGDARALLTSAPLVIEVVAIGDDVYGFGPFRQGDGSGRSTALSISGTTSPSISGRCFFEDLTIANSTDAVDMSTPHHVAYRKTASVDAIYVDGVDETTSTIGGGLGADLSTTVVGAPIPSTIAPEGYAPFLAHVALFDSDIGEARIVAHYEAAFFPLADQTTDERIDWILDELGWPSNLRDLETGRSTLGPATFKPGDGALAYLRLITASEDGSLFTEPDGTLRFLDRYWRYLDTLATTSQFTFTDTDGDRGYAEFNLDLDDELLVNVARFTRRDGTEQVASNAASVAIYGEAELQQSNLLVQTDNEALSLAEWVVATRSTPQPRVPKIRVPLHRYTAADQATVLGLDLGHRVTCARTPQGVGDEIAIDFVIDGISNQVGGGEWWWEAYVSPAPDTTLTPFRWDVSEWDGEDAWAH